MKFLDCLKVLSVFSLIIFLGSCSKAIQMKSHKSIEPLVSVEWLNAHLNDSDLIVLDVTVVVNIDDKGGFNIVNGKEQYKAGHIPNAGFADLMGNLSAQNKLNFVMPTVEQFRSVIGEFGIGNESRVVVYSAQSQDWAARLWWMLRWAGLDQVAILDGGLEAWKAKKLPLSTESSTYSKKTYSLKFRPKVVASRNEVFNSINNNQVNLIDAMPEAHYNGEFSLYARPGHIPSASNEFSGNIIAQSGFFRPIDELEMMFDGDKNNRSITYCGGGVSASLLAYGLIRSGYKDVAVYMGSLQEWTENPENPMTVKAEMNN